MTLVYQLSRWQQYIYEAERKNNPTLQHTERTGDRLVSPAWPDFQNEVMAKLYSGGVPPVEKIPEGAGWAEKLHAEVAEMGEFKRLAQRCHNDAWAAGMATSALLSSVLDAIPGDVPRQGVHPGEVQQSAEQAQAEQDADALIEAELAQQESDESGELLKQAIDFDKVRRKMRAACAKVEDEIAATDAVCAGFGFDPSSSNPQASGQAVKAALARRIGSSTKLRMLAELAGRMRRMALAVLRSKPQHGAGEISDIEQGDAIARVLPSEKLLCADELAELLFLRKWREGQLLQYQLSERPKEALGPMIGCIDHSDSMQGPPEIWSKAVLIGMAAIAEKQKRPYVVIDFASRVCRVTRFDKPDAMKLAEVSETFFGGGTAFGPPLDEALKVMKSVPAFKKADIVFISDGEATTPTEQAAECKKLGVRILGVGIGSEAAKSLMKFCDMAISVDDIRGSMGTKNAERVYHAVIGG